MTNAQEANIIESIISDITLNEVEKSIKLNQSIQSLRLMKHSSFITIFNLSNTLMGTALLVMPINFYISGMVSAIIAGVIMAIVNFATSNLIISHSKEDEIDFSEAIVRILGIRWKIGFNIISMLLLLLVGIIHFILMSQIMYIILQNIFPSSIYWAGMNEIAFNKFSIQYLGLILSVFCMVLFSFRNLKYILSINDKGIYMIMIFCLFIIYLGLDSYLRKDITFSLTGTPGKNNKGLELILFTGDINTLIGIFALAYFIHNVVIGIMKYNKNSNKNTRDLGIAYCIVIVAYSILGIFGMIGAAALYNSVYDKYNSKIPSTIAELLNNNPYLTKFQYYLGGIALGLIFLQLTTVIPILCFFTRRQFFDLIYGPKMRIPNPPFHFFNLIFSIICLVIEIFTIDINLVIGFTGAVCGFILVYIIPVSLHLKCVYWKRHSNVIDEDTIVPNSLLIHSNGCPNHKDIWIKHHTAAHIIWGLVVIFGVYVLVSLLYQLFKTILN